MLWHGEHIEYPFEIYGDKGSSDSRLVRNECCYSHVFGPAGTYAWDDEIGGAARPDRRP